MEAENKIKLFRMLQLFAGIFLVLSIWFGTVWIVYIFWNTIRYSGLLKELSVLILVGLSSWFFIKKSESQIYINSVVIRFKSIRRDLTKLDQRLFPNLTASWKQDQQGVLKEIYRRQELFLGSVSKICTDLEQEKKEEILTTQLNEVRQLVESLDRENFPQLVGMRQANKEGLVQSLLDQADARPKDSVEMMAASLESDLQHISPTR